MKIDSIVLRRLELQLVHPVLTSAGIHDRRPILLVVIESDIGIGVGECSALLESNYTAEFADGAEQILSDRLLPLIAAEGKSDRSVAGLFSAIATIAGNPMAKASIEMALLDAQLRADHCSLADFVGATTDRIAAGATVGIDHPDRVVEHVAQAVAEGYRRIKLKIAPKSDVAIVHAVRAAFPDLGLTVDANGAYDSDNSDHLAALQSLNDFGLIYIEQPLAAHDIGGHARLRTLLTTPIVLDETVSSVDVMEEAAEKGAIDGVSVKPARLGGIAHAVAVHDRAQSLGLHLTIGGMFESGVGRAAALAVGAMAGFDLPGDLGGSDRYFTDDITAPHVVADGYLSVPSGPGLGVTLQNDVVDELTTRIHRF